MNSYPPAFWFVTDRPWYKRWETWAVAAGLLGLGLFAGRGRR